nr:ABC transporter permease [Candidatus Sigynarchaeota archaeon]
MRLSKLPFRFIVNNKYKNIVTIIAISIAIFGSFSVMAFLSIFESVSEGYLNVIKRYDMIIEKSGNMVQFIPTDSVVNESVGDDIALSLGIQAFPVTFQFVNGTSSRVIPNIIAGFRFDFMVRFFSEYHLAEGRLPRDNTTEIAIGNAFIPKQGKHVSIGEKFTINGEIFTVVGKYEFDNAILDNFIIMPIDPAKNISSLNDTCNILFIEHTSLVNITVLNQFIMNNYPNLKIIDGSNVDQISASYGFQTRSWNSLISFLAPFIGISFSFTIFALNFSEIKKEMRVFHAIGTPQHVYLIGRAVEAACILVLGTLIGAILTHFLYPVFVIAALQMNGDAVSFSTYVNSFLRYIPIISSIGINTLPFSTIISFLCFLSPYLFLAGSMMWKKGMHA